MMVILVVSGVMLLMLVVILTAGMMTIVVKPTEFDYGTHGTVMGGDDDVDGDSAPG